MLLDGWQRQRFLAAASDKNVFLESTPSDATEISHVHPRKDGPALLMMLADDESDAEKMLC